MSDELFDLDTSAVDAPVTAQETDVAPDADATAPSAPVIPPAVLEALRIMKEYSEKDSTAMVLPENVPGMSNMKHISTIHVSGIKAVIAGINYLSKKEKAEQWDKFESAAAYAAFMRNYAIDKEEFDTFCSGLDAITRIQRLTLAWVAEGKK